MEPVENLWFLNEYGELETINPGDQEKASEGAAVEESGAGVMLIVSLLVIFFMFTGENGLVCCFCPYGGIWASGTMAETAATAP